MVDMLLLMTEQESLPTRPRFQNTVNLEKLACCTGHWHVCFKCGHKFKRFDKLMQHKRDKHEAARFKCICGKDFHRKGNSDRHVLNSCKKRAQTNNPLTSRRVGLNVVNAPYHYYMVVSEKQAKCIYIDKELYFTMILLASVPYGTSAKASHFLFLFLLHHYVCYNT